MEKTTMNQLAVIGNIETARMLSADLKNLILYGVIPLMCLIFVVVVGFKTRAAGPTILSVILAAMVWWGAANMDLLSDKTGEDVTQYDNGVRPADTGQAP
ncbi:hypothetical protein GCM10017744_102260 [Streptomyces antimycoticus]|uniref:Uncharacterized protein n=2 Tax=Streptomyces antimycoticus TaxID=68175 RepID=A0A4D4KTS2_9ACTN|nr:hypothetical protein SANT12839_101410 [Streptomyces antimycoticus]